MSSADNICKQFGSRSGPTKRRASSGSKLFDTLMIFLKEFTKKLILKISRRHKSMNISQRQSSNIAQWDYCNIWDTSFLLVFECLWAVETVSSLVELSMKKFYNLGTRQHSLVCSGVACIQQSGCSNLIRVFSTLIHCISKMASMRAEHFLYFNNSRI